MRQVMTDVCGALAVLSVPVWMAADRLGIGGWWILAAGAVLAAAAVRLER